jgi:hypothetical protein
MIPGFVLKFSRQPLRLEFLWAGVLFRRLCRAVTIRPFISSSTILETWGPHFRKPMSPRADLETTINDLMSGQYSDPVRVVAFNVAEGWSADASEDVAREILRRTDPQLSQALIYLKAPLRRTRDGMRLR